MITILKMIQKKKIEGYWYSEYSKEYPMPIKDELTDFESLKISELIEIKENESQLIRYRGFSHSRITGEMLGSTEFEHPDGWAWPCDFRTHYVLKFKVKPTDEFLTWIGWKT